jgi:apolipoprotein N-acyltransferase
MGNPLILYPLALVSAAGVLVLLALVYSMVCVMLLHLENKALRPRQLLAPLVGGFGLALLQIAVLDWVRFFFTGTWDGFHFG